MNVFPMRKRFAFLKWPAWLWEEPADQIAAARLRAEQFSQVARATPALMLANACNALTLAVAFWETPRFYQAFCWTMAVFLAAAGIILTQRPQSVKRPKQRHSNAMRKAVVSALILGSCWAALPLFFFQDANSGAQLLIACLCSGMLCGGAFVLASIPLAAFSFVTPIAVACFIALARAGQKEHFLIAVVLIVYTAVLLRGVWVYADQLRTRVLAQIETEEKARARMQKLQSSGLQAMGGMACSLAHEVNQPLTAAAAYLNMTLKMARTGSGSQSAKLEEPLEKALGQVSRAGQIVTHLRDFIMGAEPDRKLVRLHKIIEEACEQCGAAAARADVQFRLQLDAKQDLVLADHVQIGQVLCNLLRNAIEAVEGRVQRVITISTTATRDGEVRTDIADTGPGISDAVKEDLFSAFTTTKQSGMGVGLAVSRSIIEAHDGKIWAEPAYGGGAQFSFTLPLAQEDAGAGI